MLQYKLNSMLQCKLDAAIQTVGPSTVTMYLDTKTSVLLQTAKGYISSATNPERVAVARLILESGSKHSYISENLRAALHLQPVTQEKYVCMYAYDYLVWITLNNSKIGINSGPAFKTNK